MIYNLCLQMHGQHLAPAIAAVIFITIFMIREKRHERKRA